MNLYVFTDTNSLYLRKNIIINVKVHQCKLLNTVKANAILVSALLVVEFIFFTATNDLSLRKNKTINNVKLQQCKLLNTVKANTILVIQLSLELL